MPKLTLRDLFAVVTIVALALAWWVDHRRLDDTIGEFAKMRWMLEAQLHRAEQIIESYQAERDQTSHSK